MLNRDQVEFYRDKGYLVIPEILTGAEIAVLRQATGEIAARAAKVETHDDVFDLEDGHTTEQPRIRRIKSPDRCHPAFAEITKHPLILACLKALWGPNIYFDMGKLNMKSAGYGSPVEWHQDWAFYPHTNDDLAAVGIMIDDADLENGPMLIVPGSHKGPVWNHHVDGHFVGGIDPIESNIAFDQAVPCVGKAGSITIHHVRAVHGSAPNTSSKPRRFLLHQYRSADAWPLVQTGMPSFLVSGEGTWNPRMEKCPVRLPYPPPQNLGSIYENQRELRHRYFDGASKRDAEDVSRAPAGQ